MKSNLHKACRLLFCHFNQLNRKIKLLVLPLAFIVSSVSAQDIIFNVKTYKGGYNVSCNGSTDGMIDATVVGGTSPYTYSWNNGATTQDLINIGAGAYTLTVTDALNNSKSKSVTLFEADIIDVFLFPTLYEGGYHISKMGASDGAITTDVKGGAPPYNYLWNNGSKKANLSGLIAGTYSVTITDQNGCAVTKSITLLEPTPITISISATTYGSYNTSCYKSIDGNINVTVSGGMPPYTYSWSNGSFDEDLINVAADEYKLLVRDANKASETAQIVLTQPDELKVELTASVYPGDYNISCNGCFNGSITSQIIGGTPPATYLWKGKGVSGQITANLSNLGPGDYALQVTDANGCKTDARTFLTEPPASAWDKNGNVIDNTNFLGSTNNAPLVLKTANTEHLRISELGNVGIGTTNPQNKLDVNGNADITGSVTARQGLKFDNLDGISYSKNAGVSTFGYGKTGGTLRSPACAALPYSSVHLFDGWVQIYAADATGTILPGTGILNFQTWTGGSSIDASIGGTSTAGELLLNHFCGNKTLINTGTTGGDVQLCSSGNVGVGIVSPTEKLDIGGNVKLNSNTLYLKTDTYHGLKYSNSFGGNAIDGPVLFGYSNGVLGTTGSAGEKIALFWNENGKVGIGTTAPHCMLDIEPPSGENGLCVTTNNPSGGFGILSKVDYDLANAFIVANTVTSRQNFIIKGNGSTGIGTNEPGDLLQVGDKSIRMVSGALSNSADLNYGTSYIGFNAARNNGNWNMNTDDVHNGGAVIYSNIFGDMYFSTIKSQTSGTTNQTKTDAEILTATKLFIGSNGEIGIGTVNTQGFKLSVNGNMRAKDIIVKVTGWSDFVFDESYTRMSVLEKEAYYKKKKHLPNIESEKEILNDGLQVGKTMNGMVQNIEENTLDIADLYKRMLLLEKENIELKKMVKGLNEKK